MEHEVAVKKAAQAAGVVSETKQEYSMGGEEKKEESKEESKAESKEERKEETKAQEQPNATAPAGDASSREDEGPTVAPLLLRALRTAAFRSIHTLLHISPLVVSSSKAHLVQSLFDVAARIKAGEAYTSTSKLEDTAQALVSGRSSTPPCRGPFLHLLGIRHRSWLPAWWSLPTSTLKESL